MANHTLHKLLNRKQLAINTNEGENYLRQKICFDNNSAIARISSAKEGISSAIMINMRMKITFACRELGPSLK